MERRVAGIIRWLERCIKAYKDGAVESAFMDAECARADMETLRGDLWKKLEGRHYARPRRFSFFRTAEALFWAFGILLTAATPLALSQDAPQIEDRAEGRFTLEWITPDERELLSNVRKRLDEPLASSPGAVTAEEPIAEPQAAPVLARVAEPVIRRSPSPAPQPLSDEKIKPETSLTYDNILSLIEVGERAMKNDPPAIRVESAKGASIDGE